MKRYFRVKNDHEYSLLSVCSFNCRSFKLNKVVISDICSHQDIVLLQEHWLMPHELYMLNIFKMTFQVLVFLLLTLLLMWFVGDRTVVLQFCLGNL